MYSMCSYFLAIKHGYNRIKFKMFKILQVLCEEISAITGYNKMINM